MLHKKELEKTKHDYVASYHEGKLVDNIANLGGKKGQRFYVARSGEYQGFAIELLDESRPLLTDRLILKLINAITDDNYLSYLILLKIEDITELKKVISDWCKINEIPTPYPSFSDSDYPINIVRHDAIRTPFKIIAVGQNVKSGNSVVPEDWLDRTFKSGSALHKEMNHLPWRIGKPPVTFCAIYGMILLKDPVIDYDNIKKIYYIDQHLKINILKEFDQDIPQVYYPGVLIQYHKSIFIDKKPKKNDQASGYLSSLLQKSVRNMATHEIAYAIEKLNTAPTYQLPEMQFATVNPAKQIVWRLFISMIEDAYPARDDITPMHLILLTMILNREMKLSFSENVLASIIKYAQLICSCRELFDWRKTEMTVPEKFVNHEWKDTVFLAYKYLPMMSGDKVMLEHYYHDVKVRQLTKITKTKENKDVLLRAMDQHCKPSIIIYYQSTLALEKIIPTTKISSYLWDHNSKQNLRTDVNKIPHDIREVQEVLVKTPDLLTLKTSPMNYQIIEHETKMSTQAKRSVFLILFGKKHGSKMMTADGLKVREGQWIISEKENYSGMEETRIDVSKFAPPIGFEWIQKSFDIQYGKRCQVKINGEWENITPENAQIVVQSVGNIETKPNNNNFVLDVFKGNKFSFQELVKFKSLDKPIDLEMMKFIPLVIRKLMIAKVSRDHKFECGPVDRAGKKLYNSIHPFYEGRVWAIFYLLSKLYPALLSCHGLIFTLQNNPVLKTYFMKSLRYGLVNTDKAIPNIKMITKLWEHQKEAVVQFMRRYLQKYHGLGNASDVGSGKSLTALCVMQQMIKHKIKGTGFLVLVPQKEIINTWKTEIENHTKGFNMVIYGKKPVKIDNSTIVIATLAQMRDAPLNNYWKLVVIDECLSVQNREALQTEEAWRQSLCSSHLMMLSATFFRTRFDKLYYMLQMLQTGIPEKKEYLDTILNETILRQVASSKRKWEEEIHKFPLDKKSRIEYEKILALDLNDERKYAKLHSFLTNVSIVKHLKTLLKGKCLIYASSNEEAKEWSEKLDIPLDNGEKTDQKNVMTTWTKGTYGLNHLVTYDTIITRPPPPDKIPQMKGRLDRPGQKKQELKIIYFLWEKTIEEASLYRMTVANQFVKDHLIPLNQFYQLALEMS